MKEELKKIGFAVSSYLIWRMTLPKGGDGWTFWNELILAFIFQTCLWIITKTWRDFFDEDYFFRNRF